MRSTTTRCIEWVRMGSQGTGEVPRGTEARTDTEGDTGGEGAGPVSHERGFARSPGETAFHCSGVPPCI
jgi:hypothetical protein